MRPEDETTTVPGFGADQSKPDDQNARPDPIRRMGSSSRGYWPKPPHPVQVPGHRGGWQAPGQPRRAAEIFEPWL